MLMLIEHDSIFSTPEARQSLAASGSPSEHQCGGVPLGQAVGRRSLRGGYAVIEGEVPAALGSEDGDTTNIRMEGHALIAAMQLAGGDPCEIITSSEFWINVLTKWAPGWAAKNWTRQAWREIKISSSYNKPIICTLIHRQSWYGCVVMWGMRAMNELTNGRIRRGKAHVFNGPKARSRNIACR